MYTSYLDLSVGRLERPRDASLNHFVLTTPDTEYRDNIPQEISDTVPETRSPT